MQAGHSFSSKEQASFNFMAVVTICSDLEPKKIKSVSVSPSICHKVMGPDAMVLGPLGPGTHKVLFEPSEHLWQVWGLILNAVSPLLPSCWGFSFVL